MADLKFWYPTEQNAVVHKVTNIHFDVKSWRLLIHFASRRVFTRSRINFYLESSVFKTGKCVYTAEGICFKRRRDSLNNRFERRRGPAFEPITNKLFEESKIY
jgi:hypothetical protein